MMFFILFLIVSSLFILGDTGTDKVKLHFEIRKNGQSIDPMPFFKEIENS
jgi:murein DD-endopeptidase MepM/ murein hydrolase activator NlpD